MDKSSKILHSAAETSGETFLKWYLETARNAILEEHIFRSCYWRCFIAFGIFLFNFKWRLLGFLNIRCKTSHDCLHSSPSYNIPLQFPLPSSFCILRTSHPPLISLLFSLLRFSISPRWFITQMHPGKGQGIAIYLALMKRPPFSPIPSSLFY